VAVLGDSQGSLSGKLVYDWETNQTERSFSEAGEWKK
jgi:hypothetical protein